MNFVRHADPDFRRHVIDLVFNSGWEKRNPSPNRHVVRDAVGYSREEKLIIRKVPLTFLKHLSARCEEKACGIGVREPVLPFPKIGYRNLLDFSNCTRREL